MKYIFLIIGFLFLGIGAVGVVLPVLPTTPFLLVSAACFAKGSDRFHRWFLSTTLYKHHLKDFVQTRSMPKGTKKRILVFASTMLAFAFYFCPNIWGRVLIGLVIALKYYYFIFRIKTI